MRGVERDHPSVGAKQHRTGLAPIGVTASSDLDELVALGADCLCYASNAVGRREKDAEAQR